MSVPDAPTFTSQPLVVNSTTITVAFSLGYDGGSELTDIQYARDTDSYATWLSLPGLITPLGDNTSATITGLTPSVYGSYKIRAVNANGNSGPTDAALAYILNNGEYYTKVLFSSNNQYAIAYKFANGGTDEAAVSSNGGLTWTTITPPVGYCNDVAMSLDGGYMYYISESSGVFLSTNYGATFSQLSSAPVSPVSIVCNSTGQRVFVQSYDDNRIYASDNAGTTFTQGADIGSFATSMACSDSGDYLYITDSINVLISTDYGLTINTNNIGYSNNVACDQTGKLVFVSAAGGSGRGILVSVDYGATFVETIYSNNNGDDVINVMCDSLGNRLISLTSSGTVRVSYDAGTSWSDLPPIIGQDLTSSWSGVSISPDGTRYVSSIGTPGTFIKTEGTPDVAPVWNVLNNVSYQNGSISVDNQHIVAKSFGSSGVAYSSNAGESWNEALAFGTVNRVVANPTGQFVVAMMDDGQAPYFSTDYGSTFDITTLTPVGSVPSVYAAINADGTVITTVASDGYVYKSINSGTDWANTYQFTNGDINGMCASASLDQIYIAFYSYDDGFASIYVSNDMGTVWTKASSNLSSSNITSIACNQSGRNLVISTYNDGVYRSTDNGVTWTHLSTPMNMIATSIVSNSTGNRLVVTDGDTLWLYYVSIDSGETWTTLCTPDTWWNEPHQPIISPDGSFVISSSDVNTYFQTLGAADIVVPETPLFTAAVLIVDNSTVTLEFDLGYNGGSALTDVQYARSTNGYATWTSLGLTTPLEGQTTATITGLTPSSSGSYKLRSVNAIGNSVPSTAQAAYVLKSGEYYPKVVFSSNNQYAIAFKFNEGGVDQAAVSSDSGVTWTAITPPGDLNCVDVAMNLDGTIMYYTAYDVVYQSTDYGVGFSQLLNAPSMVASIACDSTGQKVYCVSYDDGYMYVSSDAGANFVQKASLGFSPLSIACSASGQYVYVYNGTDIHVSNDYGVTFTLTTTITQSSDITYIVCNQSGERVYVSTDGGVLCSVDYGTSFVLTSHPQVACYNVAIDSLGNRLVALAVDGTTRVSYDAGTTWVVQTILGQSLTFTSGGVSISPDGTRYASSVGAPGTYFKSEGTPDIAPIWTVINNASYSRGSISTDNQKIIALQYDNNSESTLVWYSINAGADWTQSPNFGNVYTIAASASGQVVLAIMNDSQVPYLSTDYGATFTITTLSLVGYYPDVCVINSTGTSMMVSSSDGYIYVSTDSGTTWTNPYQFTNGSTYLQCSSTSMDRIYVVVYDYAGPGITYVSTNMGTSWTSLGRSPSATDTNYIACDWSGQNLVLSTSAGDGVYRSTNGGVSWTKIFGQTGIFTSNIVSNSTGNRIVVFDDNVYVYYVSLDAGATWSTLSTPDTYTRNAYPQMISPDGSFVMSASDVTTYFQTLGAADLPSVPCFLEGSKILCQVGGAEQYVAVETIRPGTLVKTSLNGFKPVKLIGSRAMVNLGLHNKDNLYLCTKANYPELTDNLTITGCHAILVDHITDAQRQGIIKTLERVFVTDKKYRLPACVDERAELVQTSGTFTVWHFALEHADIKMNYGVYAQGLLVESSPIWHMNTKNYNLVQ
jgi:photosystem II stability/assembly factor-like uncharacterized protein